jgi:multifunctional 2-oxoglutarate metabolism enzyme
MAVNTTVQVTMPAMGESVTEGTILEWRKQEGDAIEADEILVEISTDKVDAEVPSPAGGTIVKLHVAEGDTVTVGQLLAEIASSNGGQPGASEANDESAAEAPRTATAEADTAEADTAGEIIEIVTPAGGESVTEGTILEWAVKVGDTVQDGDTIVEISTDKVDMELPAPAAGTITELVAAEV